MIRLLLYIGTRINKSVLSWFYIIPGIILMYFLVPSIQFEKKITKATYTFPKTTGQIIKHAELKKPLVPTILIKVHYKVGSQQRYLVQKISKNNFQTLHKNKVPVHYNPYDRTEGYIIFENRQSRNNCQLLQFAMLIYLGLGLFIYKPKFMFNSN
jgi:hypothetical protein